MMPRYFAFVLALVAVSMIWPASTHAEVFRGLFTGTVPVWSRDVGERKEATTRALLQVLIRASGRSSLSENAALLEGLANTQRLVRSYRYLSTEADERLQLELRFEPRFVEALLINAGLSVWPGNRPNVVVWMVRGAPQSRLREVDAQLSRVVRDYSARHGFLVRLPLLDLEDRRAVAPRDILRLRRQRLWRASGRYLADSILSGVVVGERNSWIGRWSYLYGDQLLNFAVSGDTEFAVLRTALDTIRAALTERQSLDSTTALSESMLLSLVGVERFADYAELLRYLQNLDQVRSASVVQLDNQRLFLSLDAQASPDRLRELFALDRRLTEEETAAVELAQAQGDDGAEAEGDDGAEAEGVQSATTLSYRWVRSR